MMRRPAAFLVLFLFSWLLPGTHGQMSTEIQFSEIVVKDDFRYVFGVSAVDLNNDLLPDLVAADIEENVDGSRESTLYWFRNENGQKFIPKVIWSGEEEWLEKQAIVDLNRDGRPDILIVDNLNGAILWFENRLGGSPPHWERHLLTAEAPRAYDLAVADFNGDGALDVVATGFTSNQVAWYENPGSFQITEPWTRYLISDTMVESRAVDIEDFNGDGRPDILVTAVGQPEVSLSATPEIPDSRLVWFENPGGADQFWPEHRVDDRNRAPVHGQIVDMNGDGASDILMAFGMRSEVLPVEQHGVAWYENREEGKVWIRHWIGSLPYAFDAITTDLNGDGLLEVVASAWARGDRIVYFLKKEEEKWSRQTVVESFRAVNMIISADLNRDGKPDLIATADDGSGRVEGANELRVWINQTSEN